MSIALTEKQVADIHTEATEAARKAESEFVARHGEPMYCGFAWVDVYGVRSNSKLGTAFKKVGFRKSYEKTLQLWNPGCSFTQSMDVKETGARAYAGVLRKYGIDAYIGSRAD
jgi:hypothetical protein